MSPWSGHPVTRSTISILVIFFFVGILMDRLLVDSCGPGRGHGRRRPARPLTPLVYKQHVPNYAEEAIVASGAPEGRITRTDQRFARLVTVEDENIVFKDEEGTGEDRLMTPRCRALLIALSNAVMTQWSGEVRLRVVEAWDEDGRLHSQDSLHLEGRAVDLTTSDRDRSKYGHLLAGRRQRIDAFFDRCKRSGFCSPDLPSFDELCETVDDKLLNHSSILLRNGGCFSADSVVTDDNGEAKKMSEIEIGDRLLTLDVATGRPTYGDVIAFLHRDEDVHVGNFVSIETSSGRRLTVTSNHVVFALSSRESDVSGVLTSDEFKATFAGRLTNGSYVYSVEIDSTTKGKPETVVKAAGNAAIRSDRVVRVERVKQSTGVYAPLTTSGTLIVDGVAASCYASFINHQVAHMVMAPLRFTYYLNGGSKQAKSTIFGTGIHWYAYAINKMVEHVIPADGEIWFY